MSHKFKFNNGHGKLAGFYFSCDVRGPHESKNNSGGVGGVGWQRACNAHHGKQSKTSGQKVQDVF